MRTLLALLAVAAAASSAAPAGAKEDVKSRIDVVFCIDRSGSMEGVIETAKQKIWSIVSEIAKSKPTPALRIGLIGYGNENKSAFMLPLTDDLDKVYADLVTYKVEPWGEEWVGWAVKKATDEMDWAKEKEALRIIFVVGNETALQGPPSLHYTKTVPETVKKDITVNSIYAGRGTVEELRTWKEMAKMADGAYTQIELSGGAITIETPMDKTLLELNTKLNGTYVPYGQKGRVGAANQSAQDGNSLGNGGASNLAQRAVAKSWSGYNCASWDLVDALKQKDFKLEDVKKEDLPKDLQEMTLEQKKEWLAKKQAERDAVQKEVNELAVKRQKFIDAEVKAKNMTQDSAFDEAVRKTIRGQAGKKGFTFEGGN